LAGAWKDWGEIEIILINDGSQDASWALIEAVCAEDSRFVGLNLSRNFGHQLALTAGLENARGEAVISLDADGQDPLATIAEMVSAFREGYEVVHASRRRRGHEGAGKAVTARLFYWLIGKISGTPILEDTGDFRLLSRRVLQHLAQFKESHRFLRGLVPWLGFPQTRIFFDRTDRCAGETHYSWRKMFLLAADGIASMSTAPLRLAYLFSLGLFGILLGYIVYTLYRHFIEGHTLVPGWTSIMCAVTLFGTIQLLLLGVLGEYLGRIYEQVKGRPLYIIQDIRRRP
jgi:dolichol-phosphate mannosyltransferase